ncbi:MAG: HU family DNA-binding protein [Bacteroidaceae bacterium]|nr:HU family DNA-binding protein [Bacteroidaceae bacterium]
MSNKEFIAALSRELKYTTKETTVYVNALVQEMGAQLEDGNQLSISGFGSFDVRKKLERVLINPSTKQRMLVPPKMSISFKPAPSLKEKANGK